jgi:hypothetical protein
MNRELITITEPADLGNLKPGTIIPNGVLFKLLQAYDAPIVVVDSVYRPTMELFIEIRTHRLFGE